MNSVSSMIPDIEGLRQRFIDSERPAEALPYFEGYFGEHASMYPGLVQANSGLFNGLLEAFSTAFASPKRAKGMSLMLLLDMRGHLPVLLLISSSHAEQFCLSHELDRSQDDSVLTYGSSTH